MQQEVQQKSKIFQAKLTIENQQAELMQQVLSIDNQNSEGFQINSTCISEQQQENQLELIFEGDDPKKIRSNIKHILDQLLLALETIQYAKK